MPFILIACVFFVLLTPWKHLWSSSMNERDNYTTEMENDGLYIFHLEWDTFSINVWMPWINENPLMVPSFSIYFFFSLLFLLLFLLLLPLLLLFPLSSSKKKKYINKPVLKGAAAYQLGNTLSLIHI